MAWTTETRCWGKILRNLMLRIRELSMTQTVSFHNREWQEEKYINSRCLHKDLCLDTLFYTAASNWHLWKLSSPATAEGCVCWWRPRRASLSVRSVGKQQRAGEMPIQSGKAFFPFFQSLRKQAENT